MLKITDIKIGDKIVFTGDKHGDIPSWFNVDKGEILRVNDVFGEGTFPILAYSERFNDECCVALDEIELYDSYYDTNVNETMISCGEIEDLF